MLTVQNIFKVFPLKTGLFSHEKGSVYALNGISLHIKPGEIYGLVGETGSGKTTLARTIVSLFRPSAGAVYFTEGSGRQFAVHMLQKAEIREYRSRVRYIFQDPSHSLNPRMTVRKILLNSLRFSPRWENTVQAMERIQAVLQAVDLQQNILDRYPPDFSGGQRQRISIARALLTEPELLICDEVVSALDAPIRKRILDLLLHLRETRGCSLLFISHDLTTISYISDRVGVLFRGILVEEAPVLTLLQQAVHPYTQLLYKSIPQSGWELGKKAYSITPAEPGSPPIAKDLWQEQFQTPPDRYADERPMKKLNNNHYVSEHLTDVVPL